MTDKLDQGTDNLNRLIHEKSPYLLQHAQNPVDWYPWGDKAFQKAKEENKLIFLSIGYSACHWCHVMAHESFENDSIAKIMNEHFVNIKVDREEHPDVDHLYQTFVQMTTGRGGWPLSVFLTPERVPFYGGTYFPAESRYGMISFPDLLNRVIDLYQNNPEKIRNSAEEIKNVLQNMDNMQQADSLPEASKVFENLFAQLNKSFDPEYGGFGNAPKFPHVTDMEFLLNHYHYTGKQEAKEMVLTTLRKMARGGIYDQLGGGFHRYSTDEKWLVPHFEKMLYDNALLIPVYADAYRLTGEEFFRRIVLETADFVLRELGDKDGGFYSTLDADSEGEEGKYYVWDYNELTSILDEKNRELFIDYYNLTPEGNFEGKNILHVEEPLEEIAQKHNVSEELAQERLAKGRKRLMKARSERERPGLDNKILADWNGMMISALWQADQISEKDEYRKAANKAIEYIRMNFLDDDGRLYHFVKKEDDKIAGYIDDYAFVIQALLDGFETTQKTDYLKLARELTNYVLKYFWDDKNGGFYFTDDKSDTTITRLRQNFDASTPAGGNIMALNLLRLQHYTGDQKYQDEVEKMFRLYKQDLETRSAALTSLVNALAYYHYSPVEFTISAEEKSEANEMINQVHQMFVPNRVLLHIASPKTPDHINPDLVKDRHVPDKSVAFVCYQRTCSLPIEKSGDISETVEDFGLNIH